jgi:hypothetical protein
MVALVLLVSAVSACLSDCPSEQPDIAEGIQFKGFEKTFSEDLGAASILNVVSMLPDVANLLCCTASCVIH